MSWQAGTHELFGAERAVWRCGADCNWEEGGDADIQGRFRDPGPMGLMILDGDWWAGDCRESGAHLERDCTGEVERRFTKDELLTTITIYWVTQTINSSTRLYYENQHNPWIIQPGQRIDVPCAVARLPKEISQPPREWAERFYNIKQWTEMPRGGHFAAFEEPELLAQDIRAFFRPLRG